MSSTVGSALLVGRLTEFDELRAQLLAGRDRRGATVLVCGEPGIGKTHLADALASEADGEGFLVARARCWEGDGAPAYWPWIQIARAVLEHGEHGAVPELAERLAKAKPLTDDPEGASHTRFRLFEEVVDVLRRAAGRRPLFLVVDDLHWADGSSLLLLRFAARSLVDAPVVCLGTYRDVEVGSSTERGQILSDIAAENRILRLRGLEAAESAELLGRTLGEEPSSELARTVHARSGGNPLFVLEFGRLAKAAGRASVVGTAVPEGIRPVIERRLARLSQPCWELLACAAVAGERFRLDIVAAAAEMDQDEALALLDEATVGQLVRPTSTAGVHEFTHSLVRDVVYAGQPLARLPRLHTRLGHALEAAGGDDVDANAAELAHHFLRAAEAGETERALNYAERAGHHALRFLAYEEAADHFGRALEALDLRGPDDDRRIGLLLARGDAHTGAGDLPAARICFLAAADLARRRDRAEGLARAALGLGTGLVGFEVRIADQEQLDLLEEALEALGPKDSSLRAWVLARLSVALSLRESVKRRRETADEAVAMARRLDEPRTLGYALAAHCDAVAGPADCETRIAEAREIVALASGDRSLELLGHRLLVVAYLETGDLRQAVEHMEAFERVATPLRQPLYTWYVPLWRGMQALLDGRFEEAMALATEAASVGARAHSDNAAMLTCVQRWMILHHSGRSAEVGAEIAKMLELVGPYGRLYTKLYDGWVLALSGRTDEARPLVKRLTGVFLDALPVDSEWLPAMCTWAETIARVRDIEAAERAYEILLPHASRFGVEGIGAGYHGSIERFLGLLAATLDRLEAAESHLVSALGVHRRLGLPVLEALTLRDLSHVLRRRGDEDGAAAHSSEADAIFGRLGPQEVDEPDRADNVFRRDGDVWTLAYAGSVVRLQDRKGLRDLAVLLQRPGREVAALDLHSAPGSSATTDPGLGQPGHAGEILDERARAEYKQRLVELEAEAEEAETLGDSVRAEQARRDRDTIARELADAYGLSGRPRRAKDPSERARSAVTQRIRDAIGRIEREHPILGRHLQASVRTGTFCSYHPEESVTWTL